MTFSHWILLAIIGLSSMNAIPARGNTALTESQFSKVDPVLKKRLLSSKEGELFSAFIILKKQVKLPKNPNNPYSRADLVEQLWKLAKETQSEVMSYVTKTQNEQTEAEVPEDKALQVKRFYIVNAIGLFRLTREMIAAIVAMDSVERVEDNPSVMSNSQEDYIVNDILSFESTQEEPKIYGPQMVKAPKLWKKGIEGEGVRVGVIDSGIYTRHLALRESYLGDSPTSLSHKAHRYTWLDAITFKIKNEEIHSPDSDRPYDHTGHGTHVAGTILGTLFPPEPKSNTLTPTNSESNIYRFGVAPKAGLMGCRSMQNNVGNVATYIECMQFMLAPFDKKIGLFPKDATKPTHIKPALGADIINMSIGCPHSEGCRGQSMKIAMETVYKAGMVTVVSANNKGREGCGSIAYEPGTYINHAIVVGNVNEDGVINELSSRGPVTVNGETVAVGPTIVAPGTNIYSSQYTGKDRNRGMTKKSGTSMAAPHVAGVIALLMNAFPNLKGNPDLVRDIIVESAKPIYLRGEFNAYGFCGDDTSNSIPNNFYGHGLIDALAAYEYAYERLSK